MRGVAGLVSAAHAAEAPAPQRHASLPPLERALRPRAPQATPSSYFLGIKDEILVEPLLTHEVTRVKFNRGGSSISLRLDFEGGWRAAFKPDQTNEQTVPRKEIAAYRVSRLLGLEAVAPAVGRRFPLKELVEKMDDGSRDVIPRLIDAKIEGQPIDSTDGMAAWHRYLAVGAAEPYSARALLPQISNMVVF